MLTWIIWHKRLKERKIDSLKVMFLFFFMTFNVFAFHLTCEEKAAVLLEYNMLLNTQSSMLSMTDMNHWRQRLKVGISCCELYSSECMWLKCIADSWLNTGPPKCSSRSQWPITWTIFLYTFTVNSELISNTTQLYFSWYKSQQQHSIDWLMFSLFHYLPLVLCVFLTWNFDLVVF